MNMRRWFGWICVASAAAAAPLHAEESLAQIHTPLGEMLLVLHDSDKPVTVANFKRYITSGRYEDAFVQRWEPGFVIQGGGFALTNRYGAAPTIYYVPTFGTITNEYSVGRTFSNTYGTIAMARVGGQTNSANSQWFLNLTNNAFLDAVDGGFTVFGRLVAGTNVLNRFHADTPSDGLVRYSLGGALSTMPVLATPPEAEDLIYTAFSLPAWPRAQIALVAGGARRVSWNSLSNFVNHVEFSPVVPPVWQAIVHTNGTGQVMEVVDDRPGSGGGLYRIRIE